MSHIDTQHRSQNKDVFPLSRNLDDELLIHPIEDELIVYDLKRHKASCLNGTAAQVWRWCDGATTPVQMAERLGREQGISAQEAEPVVWLALDRLQKARLLQGNAAQDVSESVTRREVMRRLKAVSVAVALPVIYTIASPDLAAAQSVPPVDCRQYECHQSQNVFCPGGCRCSKTEGRGICLPI